MRRGWKARECGDRNHRFGGDWTTSKLKILGGYLAAYTQALKNQPFKTAYIDAFAGTVLVNSVGCPLYLLCFATGNANGAPIALKIADHLLKAGEQ